MIHGEHPFAPDPSARDPVRRFRGRLTSPVTIVTSGTEDARTGLTVSSLLVVEGEPGRVHLVVAPTSDLWGTVEETSRFVIHVCGEQDRHLAEVFAGIRPSPGGIFSDAQVDDSVWGPVIEGLATRAYCSLESQEEVGWSGTITGRIDRVETAELDDPLTWFRGRFRSID